ncbi:hypothetical protein COU76_00500 [Candidatus Peregrinibacteria bacterium CG10_big_fil_rev_8_21_14_0_10_49_10]|nr:MAG: hypothetical protein COU76_00500 [Candidatus Peregrinibacteria bacterium CG10_big_fil_rev_8_21_14_0_10_49_10]
MYLYRKISKEKELRGPIIGLSLIVFTFMVTKTISEFSLENVPYTRYNESFRLEMILLFGMPALVIFASTRYLWKHPKQFINSLMIPASYIVLNFFLTLLWAYIVQIHGEGGWIFLFYWFQFVVVFVACFSINLLLYGIRRLQKKHLYL